MRSVLLLILAPLFVLCHTLRNVTTTSRSVVIDGQPELLLVATMHYPRSDPSIWPSLLRRIRAAGNNAVDTYVFWNLHEPREGNYDFETGVADLPRFLGLAKEAGLHVVLRIGPYVCAEWTMGGFPIWLKQKEGVMFRTWNNVFMDAMSGFTVKTMDVIRPYLHSNGGPIILLQIENEFGNVARQIGPDGQKYVRWVADFANSLDTDGTPWFMCDGGNSQFVDGIINTKNGFYADNWISKHTELFPDQPAMYTELWTGWFQHWGQPKFTRFAEDTAFSAARFIAKGGTYLGYYMWHGGTNFGRWGSDFKTTSYDYDAMLNEYGFPNNPKHNHIVDLNHVLLKFKHLILDNTPKHIPLGSPSVEAHIYGNSASESLVFISNNSTSNDIEVSIDFLGGSRRTMVLPHWSVLIYHSTSNSYELVFNTVSPRPSAHSMKPLQIEHSSSKLKQESIALMRIRPETSDLRVNAHVSAISYIEEPIGIWNYSLATLNAHPIEHIKATQYTSDYLWYVCEEITLSRKDTKIRVEIEGLEDIGYVYFDGIRLNQQPIVRRESDKDKSVTIEFDGVDHRIREHKLSLLVAVVGLTELGVYIERIHKGLRGAVKINGIDISNGKWFHQTGLLGENQMYHLGSKSLTPSMWKSFETAQFKDTSLTWFRVLFPKRDLLVMQKKAIQTYIHSATHSRSFGTGIEPISAFVLNLGTMSRGIAFVNGNGVQRFWNLKAVCENVSCHYPDGISDPIEGERCAVGCGYASQSWYNVPTAWIEDSGWDDVEVVVFDEAGGNPSGISIAAIVG